MAVEITAFFIGAIMTVQVSDRLSQLYVGNGVNTRFDFMFRAYEQEDETGVGVRIKVGNEFEFIDESEYTVTTNPDNMGGYVTFVNPPSAETFFYIAGKTPVDQLLDITNYDNFYPDALERALDKITAILQEWNHLVDFETKARILADIAYDDLAKQREADLKAYIDGLVSSINGESLLGVQFITQVEAIADLEHILKWEGRTVYVKSYHQGFDIGGGTFVYRNKNRNDNDGGVIINGWTRQYEKLLLEYFGAKENEDNTIAFQKAFSYLRGKIGSLTSNLKNHFVTDTCIYHDNLKIDLNGGVVNFISSGKFAGAIYNKDRTAFVSSGIAEIYYKYQRSASAQNPMSKIIVDAPKKSSSIVVESAQNFLPDDYIFISNGYCDMWRVMEQYSGSSQKWVDPSVDLWRCEISKIKRIVGNTIYLYDEISNDYLTTVKTYGLFSDENNRDDHQGWNFARIERLGGASNCSFKNIKCNNKGADISIVSYCGVKNLVSNCSFDGSGYGVDFITCYESHIANCFSSTESFGQSIRRGSSKCTLTNAIADYVSGDCPLIIWEGANLCSANNLTITGTGGVALHSKIGFYFNTCWDCIGTNITGKNLDIVASSQFCRGNIVLNNIVGVNVGVLVNTYRTFNVFANGGTRTGKYIVEDSVYNAVLCNVSESHGITYTHLKDASKYSSNAQGRIHIFKSFAVDLQAIDGNNIILWNSVDDDKTINFYEFKMKISNACSFKDVYLTASFEDGESQIRRSYIQDSTIHGQLLISSQHNNEIKNTEILGKDSLSSVSLAISHYNRFIDCTIKNTNIAFDFRGSAGVGSENWTSLIYMHNTSVEAPIRFKNYVDPSYSISINNVSPKSVDIKYISVLSDYPKLKTYANPYGNSNQSHWFQVENTKSQIIESVTSEDLQNRAHVINSIGNKWLGREVFNSTINKFMKAIGPDDYSSWVSTDNASTITPS